MFWNFDGEKLTKSDPSLGNNTVISFSDNGAVCSRITYRSPDNMFVSTDSGECFFNNNGSYMCVGGGTNIKKGYMGGGF